MAYNQLDIQHRAFKAYKKEVEQGGNESKLRKAICRAALSTERLHTNRYKCELKTDWIENIEANLPYVEKAILENRQFIIQQGEVQVIEKAKRVSKASVEHLAQHSELITHLPQAGEELVPDKIYVVENDSNFAVYENRFLYMLLLTLSDFVDVKYAKIMELWNKISTELTFRKEVSVGKRKLEFDLSFKEDSRNDPDTSVDEGLAEGIERVRNIQRTVSSLIQTPLMREVSHAPLIKLPVTRTNVLKMDTNFKMAVQLFDYLGAYGDDGYTIHEIEENIDSFSDGMEADFAELVSTGSYLCYRYGARLNAALEQRFDEENIRRREEEDIRLREELKIMKESMKCGKLSADEYIKALEKRNLSLERDRDTANGAEAKISDLNKDLISLGETCDSLNNSNQRLESEIALQKKLNEDQARLHESEINRQKKEYESKLSDIQSKYDEVHELQLATMAQLRGIRYQQGLMTEEDDYSSKEMLIELEKERNAFDKLFASQWKRAKKKIRQKAFKSAPKEQKNTDC